MATTWFYYNEQGEKISITSRELKELAASGKITPETVVETDEGKSAPARKVKGLKFSALADTVSNSAITPPDSDEVYGVVATPPAPSPFTASMPVVAKPPENPFVVATPQPFAQPAQVAPIPSANVFCTNCGNSISEQAVACMSCGAKPIGHRKFCRHCGVALNPEQVICTKCGAGIRTTGTSRPGEGGTNLWKILLPHSRQDNLLWSLPRPIFIMAFLCACSGNLIFLFGGYALLAKARLDSDAGRDDTARASLTFAHTIFFAGGVIGLICIIAIVLIMTGFFT